MRLSTRIPLVLIAFVLLSIHFPVQRELPVQREPETAAGESISFTIRYEIVPKPGTKRATLTALVPQTLSGKQKILSIRYSVEPAEVFRRDGNRYARFVLEQPRKTTIAIDVEAEIYPRDFATAEKRAVPEEKEDLAHWLKHETYLETDAPEIRNVAKRLAGKDEVETVRNVMAYVTQTLRQGPYDGADHGAVWALQKKCGDCSEFADLFVTLCRANNIPARWWEGYLTTQPGPGDTHKHDRAEVYLRKYGWVPFDPFQVHLGSATFERLRPVYVYLDGLRRNPVLKNYHYYAYGHEGGGIRVDDSLVIHRQTDLKDK